MSVYSSGSVTIKVGSSVIKGNSTSFNSYVSQGDLFKLTESSAIFDVASVDTATQLTLTSRFADSSYQTSRTENIASVGISTKSYSGTLDFNPVIQSTLSINASREMLRDTAGNGILVGDGGFTVPGAGTVDYDSGAWTINLGTLTTATVVITASYFSGNTRNSLPYQIITDYTPHKQFPEMSTSDLNFPHIYTKALRLIDKAFYAKNVRFTKAKTYTATATDQVIVVSGNASTVTIRLPVGTYANKGRCIQIINNSASIVTATTNVATNLIHDVTSTKLTSRYDTKYFVLATANLWIANPKS